LTAVAPHAEIAAATAIFCNFLVIVIPSLLLIGLSRYACEKSSIYLSAIIGKIFYKNERAIASLCNFNKKCALIKL
jgi:hypothetical protein